MIKITFINGRLVTWNPDSYTDYIYLNTNTFVVVDGQQWVGIYNLNTIESIEVMK